MVAFSLPTPKLKQLFGESFYIGVALNSRQVRSTDPKIQSIIKENFNSLSPENGLKWERIHPKPDQYNFEFGDRYVALGEEMGAFTIGHTLLWHQQVPPWVFHDENNQPIAKQELLARMENHISTVVGRYKSKIQGWDVVNEAIEEDGSFRQSPWYKIAGKDFIKKAFEFAQRADPNAELYYNDYNVWKASKRKGILEMAKELKSEGIRIDGIGMQGHYQLNSPSLEEIEQGIIDIYHAGFKVMITELDVDVLPRPSGSIGADLNKSFQNSEQYNPYQEGLPAEVEAQLAERYAELFKLFEKHKDKISRVTFWGLHDGSSWLNNFPVRGRMNYPLLFDRELNPKTSVISEISDVFR
jgi:endo-1,4-beta-xylanase